MPSMCAVVNDAKMTHHIFFYATSPENELPWLLLVSLVGLHVQFYEHFYLYAFGLADSEHFIVEYIRIS